MNSVKCWSGSFTRFIFGLLAVLLSFYSVADAPIKEMENSTVRVLCKTEKSRGTGSGFITGNQRYVITNWHVVGCVEEGGKVFVLYKYRDENHKLPAQVVWHKSKPDLAFLKLPQALPHNDVVFETEIEVGHQIWAVGFPGAADYFGQEADDYITPTVTDGRVARFIGSGMDKLIQISAPINPGNSGGPAFDQYGHVVGINTVKSLKFAPEIGRDGKVTMGRVTDGEGIGGSVPSSLIISALSEKNIPYREASHGMTGMFKRFWSDNPISLLLILSILGLVVWLYHQPQARQQLQHLIQAKLAHAHVPAPANPSVSAQSPLKAQSSLKAQSPLKGYLIGLTGQYKDCELELDNQPLVIGRDPRLSQLVIDGGVHPMVSKRHCAICYQPASAQFALEDFWSANGTFINGSTVRSGCHGQILLKAGDEVALAESGLRFKLAVR